MVNDQFGNPTITFFVSKIIKISCENFYYKKIFLMVFFILANEPYLSKLNLPNMFTVN